MARTEKPYVTLGKHLKTVREQASRSIAEVCGAVEIDEGQLKLIEAGQSRPDEDVMLLLISYFNMADQEALHLWELAHYDSDLTEHLDINHQESEEQVTQQLISKPMVMLLSMDVRTMYSDGVEVNWNQAGITLNFTQANKQNSALSVAKVGMSYEQARNVVRCLERAMLHARYGGSHKLLPPKLDDKQQNKE